jgi:integrase/recombinase XerD
LTTKNKKTKRILKAKSINRKLVSLKQFINYYNANTDSEKKVFVIIRLLKVQEQYYLDDLLTKKEFDRIIEKILEHDDFTYYALFKLMYYSGLRVSEALSLKSKNIEVDTLLIRGKGNKYREVIISDLLSSILQKYINKNNIKDDEILFKMTRQTVNIRLKKYAGLCKIKLSKAHAHNLRHLCGLKLLDSGATLEETADLLGHSNINTTRIYTRKSKKELKNTINRL